MSTGSIASTGDGDRVKLEDKTNVTPLKIVKVKAKNESSDEESEFS
jgi:hypothetical protein